MHENSAIKSFRIDQEILKGLENEARRQGATVNGLACRILRKYVKIGSKLELFGQLIFTKNDFLEIINKLDARSLKEIASSMGGRTAKELMIQIGGSLSPESFKFCLDVVLCGYMGWASYSEATNVDGKTDIRLFHNMGDKWSLFLKSYIEGALSDISQPLFNYLSSNSVIFQLP
ncbi:MAG: hypothetical protein ACUVQ5_05605 [Candidatus Methanomethylicaceae archaeon]